MEVYDCKNGKRYLRCNDESVPSNAPGFKIDNSQSILENECPVAFLCLNI